MQMNRCTFHVFAQTVVIGLCLSATFHAAAFAQMGANVSLPMTLTNNHGKTVSLTAGLYEGATDSLDSVAGERELPPIPPAEIFDVRFVGPTSKVYLGEGSLRDVRALPIAGSKLSITYRIKFQAGLNVPSVTMQMPASFSYMITRVRVDGKTVKAGDSIVSAVAAADFNLTIDFDLTDVTFQASPVAVNFHVGNRDLSLPAPVKVTVTPSVSSESWSASATDSWISIDRVFGQGAGDITIGIAYLNFPTGRTSGQVEIRSSPTSAATIIPVTVDMVVGVKDPLDMASFQLERVYPQPATVGSPMCIEYRIDTRRVVTCTIHDMLGRRIRLLQDGVMTEAGQKQVSWDLRSDRGVEVVAGVYQLAFDSEGLRRTSTIIVK